MNLEQYVGLFNAAIGLAGLRISIDQGVGSTKSKKTICTTFAWPKYIERTLETTRSKRTVRPSRVWAMTPPHGSASRRPFFLLGLMTILALPYALSRAFSGFPWFDDEGTMLITIRAFVEGHRMYDEVYSLYGPLFNLFYGLLYGPLGIPATHEAGRLISASLWLAWTSGFALFCFRLSRSIASMLVCYVALLIWMNPVMDSPGHPEGMCLVLISANLLLTCLLERNFESKRPESTALLGLGATVSALALIKINVGLFIGLPLLVVLLRQSSNTVLATVLAPLVALCLILLPVALQAILFHLPWVRAYSLFGVLSIAATCLVYLRGPRSPLASPGSWTVLTAGGSVTALLAIGGMLIAGSSAFGILNSVILQTPNFVRNWNLPILVGGSGLLAAFASFALASAYCFSITEPKMRPYSELGVTLLQAVFVLVGLSLLFLDSPLYMFRIVAPFCWLLLVPPDAAANSSRVARPAAALIGVTMSLYAFPVAGHQVNIATALPIVILPVLARDVAVALRGSGYDRYLPLRSWLTAAASTLAIAIGAVASLASLRTYYQGEDLGLPGTSFIRIDRQQAEDLRWVTVQLSSCHVSYSIPGLYSFSLWTGHAPPTMLNINAELNFLSAKQQDAIVDALSRETDLCVVYNPRLLDFLDRGQAAANPPLLRFMSTALAPSSERHGYVILRRRPNGA